MVEKRAVLSGFKSRSVKVKVQPHRLKKKVEVFFSRYAEGESEGITVEFRSRRFNGTFNNDALLNLVPNKLRKKGNYLTLVLNTDNGERQVPFKFNRESPLTLYCACADWPDELAKPSYDGVTKEFLSYEATGLVITDHD